MHQWKREREGESEKFSIKGNLEGPVSLKRKWINSIKISQNKYASKTEKQSPWRISQRRTHKTDTCQSGVLSRKSASMSDSTIVHVFNGKCLAFLPFLLFVDCNPPLKSLHSHSDMHTTPRGQCNSEPRLRGFSHIEKAMGPQSVMNVIKESSALWQLLLQITTWTHPPRPQHLYL